MEVLFKNNKHDTKTILKSIEIVNESVVSSDGYLSKEKVVWTKEKGKKYSVGYSQFNSYVNIAIKDLEIGIVSKKPKWEDKTYQEYSWNKNSFWINLFVYLGIEHISNNVRTELKKHNLIIDHKMIIGTLLDSITTNKPVEPFISNKIDRTEKEYEEDFYNLFFKMVLTGLNNCFLEYVRKNKIPPHNQTQILKYFIFYKVDNSKILQYLPFRKNRFSVLSSQVYDSSYKGGILGKLSNVWFSGEYYPKNKQAIEENFKEYKVSFGEILENIGKYNRDELKDLFGELNYKTRVLNYPNDIYSETACELYEVNPELFLKQYAVYFVTNSFPFSRLLILYKRINDSDYYLEMNPTFHVKKYEGCFDRCYEISVTMRDFSPFDNETKNVRKNCLKGSWGHVDSFDIHSCDYTTIRLLNSGELDINRDFKEEIVQKGYQKYNYGKWVPLVKKDLSALPHRFLSDDEQNCWINYYKNKDLQKEPIIGKETFYKLKEDYMSFCGDADKYRYCLLLYEMIWYLYVVLSLVKRNCHVEHIYDEIFFNPIEISREDVKKILSECGKEMYEAFSKETLKELDEYVYEKYAIKDVKETIKCISGLITYKKINRQNVLYWSSSDKDLRSILSDYIGYKLTIKRFSIVKRVAKRQPFIAVIKNDDYSVKSKIDFKEFVAYVIKLKEMNMIDDKFIKKWLVSLLGKYDELDSAIYNELNPYLMPSTNYDWNALSEEEPF